MGAYRGNRKIEKSFEKRRTALVRFLLTRISHNMSAPGELQDGQMYLSVYLLDRLAQLGVKPMFGVPGDFNLVFLDEVEKHKDIEWLGCCNELNASYAADGYARVKQAQLNRDVESKNKTQGGVKGLAALLTTFGVGELSAVNGIAGAYSERVPIIHVVGVPSTKLQKNKALLHHTLGDGKFNVFEEASRGITCAQAFLSSADNAAQEVDRILLRALETARPAYLTLPTDLVYAPVDASRLKTPIIPRHVGPNETDLLPTGKKVADEVQERTQFVLKEIQRLFEKAKQPIVLIDACAIRYGVGHLVRDLIRATGVKFFTTPMGRNAIDEDPDSGFGGVYVGEIADEKVKAVVEATDLCIMVGALKSDFNTGEFSYKFPTEQTIELHSDHTQVQYGTYPEVSFHTLLPLLASTLKSKQEVTKAPRDGGLDVQVPEGSKDEMVKQEAFWPMMGQFLQEDDIIVAETGTSSFGIISTPLPKGATVVSQVLWGSIGYAGGATLGCLMAAKESPKPRRVILFTGDGSIQLTVQDIATMLKHGLKPILVILNNDGYTIERLIHGKQASYNDISSWRWQSLLDFFDASGEIPKRSWQAKTRGELEDILRDDEFKKADKCQLLEVLMEKLDAPAALIKQGELSAQLNAA
ncbi:alpha-keto acid decarboxylase family protein [Sporobolomyces koalae]|uniref:alpha-keto acid decarboxylase family protein n=1 Tax=Sporobolomyces koalae TaxID=500713 RepID=UPI00316C2487